MWGGVDRIGSEQINVYIQFDATNCITIAWIVWKLAFRPLVGAPRRVSFRAALGHLGSISCQFYSKCHLRSCSRRALRHHRCRPRNRYVITDRPQTAEAFFPPLEQAATLNQTQRLEQTFLSDFNILCHSKRAHWFDRHGIG